MVVKQTIARSSGDIRKSVERAFAHLVQADMIDCNRRWTAAFTNGKTAFVPSTEDDIHFASTRMKSYREYNDLVIPLAAKRLGILLFSFDRSLNYRGLKPPGSELV